MNKFRLGIVAKGLILVSIPLVFECGFVAVMASLQAQAEAAAVRAERTQEISNLINELIQELYTGLQSLRLNVAEFAPGSAHKARISTAKEKIGRLLTLIGNDRSQDQATLQAVSRAVDEGNALVMRAEQAFLHGDEAEEMRIRIESKHFAEKIITPELIALSEKQNAISASDPAAQAELRQSMHIQLWLALILNILGTVGLAFLTTRLVTKRLAYLADNGRRIAQGQKLRELAPGTDEIAELDFNLHKMAKGIDDLLQRERIIIQNARDIICVTDNNLNILRISPYVESALGIPTQRLVGASCLTLLERNINQDAIVKISAAAKGSSGTSSENFASSFEGFLKTTAGKALNVLISLSRVPKEGNLILIFHDITSLKEAERLKQDVVNMVSEDLRSPLTMVSHIFEKFEQGLFGEINQDGKNMLSMAKQSTRQMSVLITDLLDLDKIESGTLRLATTSISSQQLLERAQVLTSDQARQARCQVRIDCAQGLVSCDPDRVNQILTNLIGNALKFSQPGVEIIIKAESKSQMVHFSVEDQGPGIPAQLRERIFERFAQVRESDQNIGTGLGLTICKALVELHGGTIWVKSNSELGQSGSTFTFTMPEVRRQLGPAVTRT
ncbi:PAS domain S-box protein [bacterium]|nr:PAS domain S-box protein [bacterium]